MKRWHGWLVVVWAVAVQLTVPEDSARAYLVWGLLCALALVAVVLGVRAAIRAMTDAVPKR